MKKKSIGDILIILFAIISIICFMFMFGLGTFYLECSTFYSIIGIICILSATISFTLLEIKNEK